MPPLCLLRPSGWPTGARGEADLNDIVADPRDLALSIVTGLAEFKRIVCGHERTALRLDRPEADFNLLDELFGALVEAEGNPPGNSLG